MLQAAGHHVIKAGVNVEAAMSHQDVGSYTMTEDGTAGAFISQNAGFGVLNGPDNPIFGNPLHIKTTSVIAGGFLQDSWSIMDVITANFGLRYDTQQLYNGAGDAVMTLPNQWSPRLGVIYDPTPVRARQRSTPTTRDTTRALGSRWRTTPSQVSQTLWLSSSGPNGGAANCNSVQNPQSCSKLTPNSATTSSSNGLAPPNAPYAPSQTYHVQGQGIDSIDPNIRPTTEDDFVAGGEYEILKDARAGLSYQRRWLVRWLEDSSNDATSTFFLSNPGYGWASGFPTAQRTYDAGTAYLSKTFGDDWLATGSYTLSYLRGNIAGAFLTSGEFDPNHNASFFDTKAFND